MSGAGFTPSTSRDRAALDEAAPVKFLTRKAGSFVRRRKLIRGEIEDYPFSPSQDFLDVSVVVVCGFGSMREGLRCSSPRACGDSVHARRIIAFCFRGQLRHYKIPRYVAFVDNFLPMTVYGKVQSSFFRSHVRTRDGSARLRIVL